MEVQRSHFRRYLSITLIVLFMLTLAALLHHGLPSIAMPVLAWERPVVGFVAFLVIAAGCTLSFVRDYHALTGPVLFVFPLLLVASLFDVDPRRL
jgi:hypothetical protein